MTASPAPTKASGFAIDSLNHVVLWVSDLERSERFYGELLGLQVRRKRPGRGVFYTCGTNDHDIAIFQADPESPKHGDRHVGLYHFALKLNSFDELKAAYKLLVAEGAVAGVTHHGDTKSVYVKDPDGMEIELFVEVPEDSEGSEEKVRAELEAE